MTVQEAVAEAVDKNLGLLAKRYDLSIADARIITAGLRPNPVLSLGADHLDWLGTVYAPENGPAGPPEYSARFDWLVEGGGKRGARLDAAQLAKQVVQLQLLDATREVILEVQNAFLEVLVARLNLALAEENKTAFEKIIAISTDRVRAGDLAKVELMRTRLADLQFANAVIHAQLRLRVAKQKLQLLMGRTVASNNFEIAGELPKEPLKLGLPDLQLLALERRPDYLALQRDQARSVAEIRLQLALGHIDYNVGFEYRRQSGIAGQGNSLGFFFSMPLQFFDTNQGEISRAEQEQKQIEARITQLQAEIKNDLGQVWQQYESARALVTQIEAMLEEARQVMKTMAYSYRVGHASLIELLDAQRAFNDTMLSYNEARAEYARSLVQIEAATGSQAQLPPAPAPSPSPSPSPSPEATP